jgi:hypothetical protein
MSTSYGSNPSDRGRFERQAAGEEQSSTRASGRGVRRDKHSVVARESEQFGGIKVGSAFFGWLTATGMAVLLTALLAAAGTAVGVANNAQVGQAATSATQNAGTVGAIGAIVLLVILFVAYFCGGYVAGRMARFNGARQGLMVWLWAVLIAILVAVAGVVGGSKYNVLAQLNAFPRIPVDEGDLTTAGIVALVIVALASLAGAILGGMAGMRFHRRVDEVGLEAA